MESVLDTSLNIGGAEKGELWLPHARGSSGYQACLHGDKYIYSLHAYESASRYCLSAGFGTSC